jgi:Trypsin-co-occurring domain 1
MSELLEFKSDQGGVVLVEVAELPGGPVTRGGRSRAAVLEAGESLERVLGQVGPVVKGIVSELRAAADWPAEVEVEFAVKVSADSNVIIARAGGEANFRISMRWSREPGS